MKKTILTLAACAMAALASAQDGHLLFKGVEVTGTVQSFAESLKGKGFTVARDGSAEGMFAGNHVVVSLETTPLSKTVSTVTALLDVRQSWRELREDYDTYRINLTEKYGPSKASQEHFYGAYREGDGFELRALQMEKCTWSSMWDKEDGRITISIVNTDKGCRLMITYADAEGTALAAREVNEIFKEDL